MANDKQTVEAQEGEKSKSLHIKLPEAFHTRVKMLCVMKKSSIMAYAQAALEEKVARDEAALTSARA